MATQILQKTQNSRRVGGFLYSKLYPLADMMFQLNAYAFF